MSLINLEKHANVVRAISVPMGLIVIRKIVF
jgi:hypothetical protein